MVINVMSSGSWRLPISTLLKTAAGMRPETFFEHECSSHAKLCTWTYSDAMSFEQTGLYVAG